MQIWGMLLFLIVAFMPLYSESMQDIEKRAYLEKTLEMFYHGFSSYMTYAYPADELMPLSCKGRWRGSEPCRGDIDEALGNFSLTLVDSLDTLAVLGDFRRFEDSLQRIIKDVTFDHDITVSVFETNIRVLGGLLSGHVLTEYIRGRYDKISWYKGELLTMALDVGYRLLPAFNTTTGIPHAKINLRHGMKTVTLENSRETCTACAGTMILEFAALSRLSGDPIFEAKAHRAMDQLWSLRNRASDLVGTVLNVHSGEWVRRESGVGAGIDSYYEYCLKAYILLGEERYNSRFDKHYRAVMKYVSQGPILLDVHMHRPNINSKNFMDSLQAFWPGLQVLKGDLQPAVETHEMLYQVMQKHNFLPEAFTTDFQVHWGQHPLRPEFVESTYFLYRATNDPHYLEVGAKVLDSLERYARVQCGFAAVKDVRTGHHEDKMDSFVLAETFKYLYLLFADPADLKIDVEQFVFTTEAHLLPLSLARLTNYTAVPLRANQTEDVLEDIEMEQSCPAPTYLFAGDRSFLQNARKRVKESLAILAPAARDVQRRLLPAEFQGNNPNHLTLLREMGITVITLADGKVQLLHSAQLAKSQEDAREGLLFMQEMMELSKMNEVYDNGGKVVYFERAGQLAIVKAGPAQFGPQLVDGYTVEGEVVVGEPENGCNLFNNGYKMKNKIVLVQRGDCMFIDKVRQAQAFGAAGVIVGDYHGSVDEQKSAALFSMSGDGKDDVVIPSVFVLSSDAKLIRNLLKGGPLVVTLAEVVPEEHGDEMGPSAFGPVSPVQQASLTDILTRLQDDLVRDVREKIQLEAEIKYAEVVDDNDSEVFGKGEVFEVSLDENANANLFIREVDGSSVITPIKNDEQSTTQPQNQYRQEFLASVKCLIGRLLDFHKPEDTRLPHEEIAAKYSLLADLSTRLKRINSLDLVLELRDVYKSFKGSSAGISANLVQQVTESVKVVESILSWPQQCYDDLDLVLEALKDPAKIVDSETGHTVFMECFVSYLENAGGKVGDLKERLIDVIAMQLKRTDGGSSVRDEL